MDRKTTLPGSCLAHFVIGDKCRKSRGNDGAFKYAVNGVMRCYDSVLMNVANDAPAGFIFHVALIVENTGSLEVRQELADDLETRLRRAYFQRDDVDFDAVLQEVIACIHD